MLHSLTPTLALHEELLIRLLTAAILGGCIGFERERLSWAAGLRTHMLVCVGSCLVMIVSAFGFADVQNIPGISLDPSRMAAQVVSGIGFLGAGAILMRGEIIRGLTTAASLWAVAAVGLAVGGGMYLEAAACTLIMLVILAGIKPLEDRYRDTRQLFELHLRAKAGTFTLDTLRTALGDRTRRIRQFICRPGAEVDIEEITLTLIRLSPKEVAEILQILQKLPNVQEIHESRQP